MKKDYTVCILLNKDLTKTLLIKKAEGKLFAGKYNGLGGKIEEGETLKEACIREVKEESSGLINLKDPKYLVTISSNRGVEINLNAFYDVIDEVDLPPIPEGTSEWVPIEFALDFNNDKIVGNGNYSYFTRLAILNETKQNW